MNKILITGAGGFIGHYLFNYLKKKKNIKLYGIINKLSRKNLFLKKNLIKKRFFDKNVIVANLSNLKKVKKIIIKINPNIIFHFAAMTNHYESEKNKDLCKKNNTGITKNILKFLNKECTIIFLSTDKVYSINPELSPEHTNLKPKGILAKEKLRCEKIIIKKFNKFFILRLPIVHNSGQNEKYSTIDKFLYLLKKNKKINVYKNVKRSFLKINELIKFLEKLISNNKYGIYNIGSKVMSYNERVEQLCRIYNIDYKKNIDKVNGNINPLIQKFNTNNVNKNIEYYFS
jgi:nucleoside-diphosphate-sugar epimerase